MYIKLFRDLVTIYVVQNNRRFLQTVYLTPQKTKSKPSSTVKTKSLNLLRTTTQ
jgi:hypothetical protein